MDKRAALVAELPHLMRYARSLTRDADAANDLVQDTAGRALSRLHLFQAGTNMRAWLFTVMHNLHRQNMRSLARRPSPVPINEEVENRLTAVEDTDQRLALRDLDRALGDLPDEQRDVVLLIGLEDMSYQQTADVLGIPVGTVMSRLARARERLRRAVDGQARPQLRSVT
jgi:RNA polymerase sigma-70 factor (ECF subfamily)